MHYWPVLKRKLLEIRAPSGQTKECSFLNSGSHRFFSKLPLHWPSWKYSWYFRGPKLGIPRLQPPKSTPRTPKPQNLCPNSQEKHCKTVAPSSKKKNVVFPGLGIWLLHILGVWRGTLRENFVLQHDFVDLCLWFWGAHCANLWFFKSFTQNLGSRPRLRAWKWTKITVFFKITCGATLSFHQAPT